MDASNLYFYRGTVVKIVDGDTVDIECDLGFYVKITERFRLLASNGGVNTPEMHAKDPAVRAAAQLAKTRTEQLAPIGSTVFIKTEKDERDGFRRYLAQVINAATGANVGDTLLAEGLAVIWVKAQ